MKSPTFLSILVSVFFLSIPVSAQNTKSLFVTDSPSQWEESAQVQENEGTEQAIAVGLTKGMDFEIASEETQLIVVDIGNF